MSSEFTPGSESSEDEQSAPDRSTAHVALVCTHSAELQSLTGRLDRRRRYADGRATFTGGFLEESIRVAIVEAGTGYSAHREAALTLIAEHRPAWVISAGFSSSLEDDVHAGDLSLATAIRDTHGQELKVACPVPESRHATLRTHLVADRHPETAEEKRELARTWQASAVDTTSLAVAQVCEESGTGFLSIRAIIDDVDEELPAAAIELLFAPTGKQNLLGRWMSGMRQPPAVKACRARAATSSERLDRFLTGVIRQLNASRR